MVKKFELKALDRVGEFLIIFNRVLLVLLTIKQVENSALHLLFDLVYKLFVKSDKDLFHLVLWCAQTLVLCTQAKDEHAELEL